MRKIFFSMALLLSSTLAVGQVQVYACQFTHAAGFKAEGTSWRQTNFRMGKPFFLRVEEQELSRQSAASVMNAFDLDLNCTTQRPEIPSGRLTVFACNDPFSALAWSPESGNGALTQIFGAIQRTHDRKKDDVAVHLFTCQRM